MTGLPWLAVLLAADPDWSLASERLAAPEGVAPAVAKLLAPTALRVERNSQTQLTFWLRGEVPATATPEQVANGLTFEEIAAGTLLGVVRIEQPWIDFRKQDIPAGIYTLRLAFQPATGDHRDTAPQPSFALLTPIAADRKPDAIEQKTLVERSSKITGGDHPAVLLLWPEAKPPATPKLSQPGKNIRTIVLRQSVRADAKTTALGLGITIAGHSAKRE